MSREARLIAETGPCKGREFVIPANGSARVGRSSSNDIALTDPSVSRFHCRIFFKAGKGLWLADLSSSNQTLVNGKTAQEMTIVALDRIAIGDSTLKVISDGSDPAPAAPPASPGSEVDLGLAATNAKLKNANHNIPLILLLTALAVMSVLVVWVFFVRKQQTAPTVIRTNDPGLDEFELRYEKVDGNVSNIFQCVLIIRGTQASIEFHDIADRKHIRKPMIDIDRRVMSELLSSIKRSGVMTLPKTDYVEASPDTYNLRDLSVLLGTNSVRVKVLNASEPPELESVRKILDAFGENEFNIRSLTYPREELIRLANEKRQLGIKLYEGREHSRGNLFNAGRSLSEAIVFLETVDPKPDFYQNLVATHDVCERELRGLLKDLWLQADLATKVKDWQEAANVLSKLCDTVPDPSDEDYKKAEQQLTDAQRRLKR